MYRQDSQTGRQIKYLILCNIILIRCTNGTQVNNAICKQVRGHSNEYLVSIELVQY